MDGGNAADFALGERHELGFYRFLVARLHVAENPDKFAANVARSPGVGGHQTRTLGYLVANFYSTSRDSARVSHDNAEGGRIADLDFRRGELFNRYLGRLAPSRRRSLAGVPVPSAIASGARAVTLGAAVIPGPSAMVSVLPVVCKAGRGILYRWRWKRKLSAGKWSFGFESLRCFALPAGGCLLRIDREMLRLLSWRRFGVSMGAAVA